MSIKIDNQTFFNQHKTVGWANPPIVVAWKFSSAENLGALLRVCDNFGVKKVFFVGEVNDYKGSRIKRNATTSFKKIDWNFISELEIWNVIPNEFTKIAIDTTSHSIPLNQYDFTKENNSFCFFLGNETIGLENSTLQKCDESIHISMIGDSLSMNVVNAASVVLYETTKQCLLVDNND